MDWKYTDRIETTANADGPSQRFNAAGKTPAISPIMQTYAAKSGHNHLVFFSRLVFRYAFLNVAKTGMMRLLPQATTVPSANQKKYEHLLRRRPSSLVSEQTALPSSYAWIIMYASPTNAVNAKVTAMEFFQFSLMKLNALLKAFQNSDCSPLVSTSMYSTCSLE